MGRASSLGCELGDNYSCLVMLRSLVLLYANGRCWAPREQRRLQMRQAIAGFRGTLCGAEGSWKLLKKSQAGGITSLNDFAWFLQVGIKSLS